MIARMLYVVTAEMLLSENELKPLVSFCAAFLASILACIASHPGDILLTTTYKSSEAQSISNISSKLYKSNGIGGFFQGLDARLVHVVTIITSQLFVYDVIKQLLGLPATGSQ